jgi:MFS transporter, FHS family, L-fucose permease
MAGALPISSATSSKVTGDPNANYRAPLAALTTLFFMWGFLTCLNDIIIPHLKAIFELSYTKAMMVQFAFFAAYFVVSPPAGRIVHRVGYKRGIILGLAIAGVGCLLFYPAAGARSYPLFLVALLVLASGITILQVSANPFVAVLGPSETASSRLSLTQGFNSLGTTIAPIFGAQLILSTAVRSADDLRAMTPEQLDAYRVAEAASVQRPYLGLALALVILAIAVAL